MKVLFVCRENRGRSQIASGFYHQLRPGDAASAGTIVDNPGQKLGELVPASQTVAVMNEIGIDVSGHVRTQLTQEAIEGYDKVIVMSEPENTPDWLRENPKTEIWSIKDPKGKTAEDRRIIRDDIRARVIELDRRLHKK
jgi:protein-tyrosine-phosphatase